MTNEEHIEQLKKLRSFHNGSYGRSINKAIEALKKQEPSADAVSRQEVKEQMIKYGFHAPDMTVTEFAEDELPSVRQYEPKTGRLTNSEWIDFLSEQFDISRTSAKEMLHVMMSVKKEDNFKKQFSGRK